MAAQAEQDGRARTVRLGPAVARLYGPVIGVQGLLVAAQAEQDGGARKVRSHVAGIQPDRLFKGQERLGAAVQRDECQCAGQVNLRRAGACPPARAGVAVRRGGERAVVRGDGLGAAAEGI